MIKPSARPPLSDSALRCARGIGSLSPLTLHRISISILLTRAHVLEHPLARWSTGTTATLRVSPQPCAEVQPSTLQGNAEVWEHSHVEIHIQLGPCILQCVSIHTCNQHTHAQTQTHTELCTHKYTHTCVPHTGSPAGSSALVQPRLRAQPFHMPTQPLTPTSALSLLDSSGRKSTSLHPAPGPSHPGHGIRPHCLPNPWWVWHEPSSPALLAQHWFFSPSPPPRDADAMAMHKPKVQTA